MIERKENKDLEERIERYANGMLDAEQIDELWAELIQDEYYLDYMKSVVNLKAVLTENKSRKKAKIFELNKFTKYATSAAVILVIGVLGILNYSNQTNVEGIEPIDNIGLDIVRDAEGVSEAVTNEAIRTAIKLASEGETQQAILILEDEMATANEPQVIAEISLTLGSIYYNAGNYSQSIENFKVTIKQPQVDILTLEKGYWYLGNAYFQLDQLEEAEESFQKAFELNGAFSRVAKTYVDALNNVL